MVREYYTPVTDAEIEERFFKVLDRMTNYARLMIALYLLRHRGYVSFREIADFVFLDKPDYLLNRRRYYMKLYRAFYREKGGGKAWGAKTKAHRCKGNLYHK